jgi:hypothetical protein
MRIHDLCTNQHQLLLTRMLSASMLATMDGRLVIRLTLILDKGRQASNGGTSLILRRLVVFVFSSRQDAQGQHDAADVQSEADATDATGSGREVAQGSGSHSPIKADTQPKRSKTATEEPGSSIHDSSSSEHGKTPNARKAQQLRQGVVGKQHEGRRLCPHKRR